MQIAADFLLPGVLLFTARKAGLARATLREVRTAAQRYSMKGESIPSRHICARLQDSAYFCDLEYLGARQSVVLATFLTAAQHALDNW